MSTLLRESMTKAMWPTDKTPWPDHTGKEWGRVSIRCWREEPEPYVLVGGNASHTRKEITDVLDKLDHWSTIEDIAQALIKIDRMNAVEVLWPVGLDGGSGDGVVLYKDWP